MSDNSEVSYIVNLGINLSSNAKLYRFIGKLIAKALIDNIAINLCFNKIIYKLILNEKVTFDDLVFIDKQVSYLQLTCSVVSVSM